MVSEQQDIVTIARQIATKAHRGQVDKAGVAYIEHPKYTASVILIQEGTMAFPDNIRHE